MKSTPKTSRPDRGQSSYPSDALEKLVFLIINFNRRKYQRFFLVLQTVRLPRLLNIALYGQCFPRESLQPDRTRLFRQEVVFCHKAFTRTFKSPLKLSEDFRLLFLEIPILLFKLIHFECRAISRKRTAHSLQYLIRND